MNVEGYRTWLEQKGIYRTKKLVCDCVSRTKRVEKAFQAIDPNFSLDKEFEKDKGVSFAKYISRRGIAVLEPVALPLHKNQMDVIVSSTKKYFIYLSEIQK